MNIYYFAYGTNLNRKIFLKKFKDAKIKKKYYLKNFKVVFRTNYRVPDLQRDKNSKTPGLIYEINNDIVKKLDKYEDFPKLYIKKHFKYYRKKIMYYCLKKKFPIKYPSGYYFKIMKNGYRQNKFKFKIKKL